jgi:hypothetical protein
MTGLGHDLPIEPNADEWLFWVGLSHPDEADLTTAVLAIGAAQALKITQQTAASGGEPKILNQVVGPCAGQTLVTTTAFGGAALGIPLR